MRYDVVVAGAGPAGSAAATRLAEAGLEVLLVDRHVFPRDKVCGDFVSPIAMRELEAIGIAQQATFAGTNVIANAAVFLDGERLLTAPIPVPASFPTSRVVRRESLDALLLTRAQVAGATVLEGWRVMSFKTTAAGIIVHLQDGERDRTIGCEVLVGADGSNSTVARQMRGRPPADDDRIVAVRGYYHGIAGPDDRADLHFSSEDFPGYCWVFPVGGRIANVGLGLLRNTLPPTRDHLRAQLDRFVASDGGLRERLSDATLEGKVVGWALTTYNKDEPLVDDRVLLVGDAAGLINPLNGEGIQSALLSGAWAAETIVSCSTAAVYTASALAPYANKVAAELGADFAFSRAIVQLIRNRSLNPLWIEALRTIVAAAATDPEYARITGGALAGVVPTRELMKLAVVRKTLTQAASHAGDRGIRAGSLTPDALLTTGVRVSELAIDVASSMLEDQAALKRWMVDPLQAIAGAGRASAVTSTLRNVQTITNPQLEEDGRADRSDGS